MVKRNENIGKLKPSYLFPEIHQRKIDFLAKNPSAKIISLGIGDTTQPLPEVIAESLSTAAKELGTVEGYTGYGPPNGHEALRQKIAEVIYNHQIKADEIFISDGTKCDIGRLQLLFGSQPSVAIQDPAYPVYVDGSIMQGIQTFAFLPCLPENEFFPDLQKAKGMDLIYFCSPNNPTGAVATKQQLEQLVHFAKENGSIIIFDAAYAAYIRDKTLPKSIFEIEGAKEVALEAGSFSKLAGFTGIRLGWTVIPDELRYEGGSSVKKDWARVVSTLFNGASNIAQRGGLTVLENLKAVEGLISFYMENARLIKEALSRKGLAVYGGVNAPYLWVKFEGRNSWEVFQDLLEKSHLLTTPGSGFGSSGEGFIRMTAFGSREEILEAVERIKKSDK